MIELVGIVLAVFSLGIILGYLIARRAFDKAIAYLDLCHHQENLDRNYNFLKLGRITDKPQNRHWDN